MVVGLGNVGMHVWHVHECVMQVRYQCSVQVRQVSSVSGLLPPMSPSVVRGRLVRNS